MPSKPSFNLEEYRRNRTRFTVGQTVVYFVHDHPHWAKRGITQRTGTVVKVYGDGIHVMFQDGNATENGVYFFAFEDGYDMGHLQ